jgi:hypothetical protein
MLAYCEVCRVVIKDPSNSHKGSDAELRQFRQLIENQFFAYCSVCSRTQIFTKVDVKDMET